MKEILESYKLPELKRIVRATNITGYSKLKKDELIKLMMRPEHIDRFRGLKSKDKRDIVKGDKKAGKVVRQFKRLAKPFAEFKQEQEEKKKIAKKITKKDLEEEIMVKEYRQRKKKEKTKEEKERKEQEEILRKKKEKEEQFKKSDEYKIEKKNDNILKKLLKEKVNINKNRQKPDSLQDVLDNLIDMRLYDPYKKGKSQYKTIYGNWTTLSDEYKRLGKKEGLLQQRRKIISTLLKDATFDDIEDDLSEKDYKELGFIKIK